MNKLENILSSSPQDISMSFRLTTIPAWFFFSLDSLRVEEHDGNACIIVYDMTVQRAHFMLDLAIEFRWKEWEKRKKKLAREDQPRQRTISEVFYKIRKERIDRRRAD